MTIKPIFIFAIIALVGVGYYAWKQQQRSFTELRRLESSGVNADVTVISRPLVAIDSHNKTLHLAYPDKIISMPWRKIKRIDFIEARVNNKKDSQPVGPDKMTIYTTEDVHYNITDLRTDASTYYQQFVALMPDTNIILKSR